MVAAVCAEAERQGLDPIIVCSLVEVESEWRIYAKSRTGDNGIFQINEHFWGRWDDNATHIRKGTSILVQFIHESGGNVLHGLSRYNTGRVSAQGIKYAQKVLGVAHEIRERLGGKRWKQSCWQSFAASRFCWWGAKLNEWCIIGERRRRMRYVGQLSYDLPQGRLFLPPAHP